LQKNSASEKPGKRQKKKIEEQLREQFERSVEALKRDRLLAKLVEEHKIEVPETLVRRELDNLIKVRLNELQQLGIDPKQVNQQQLVQELLPVAVFNVASRLILDKYADKLGVEVTDEEVEKELEKLAQLYNVSPQEFKAVAQQQGLIESIKADLRRTKALDELAKKVKFVEVEPKEEEKQQEATGGEDKEENTQQEGENS
jgi:trigger factor